MLEDVIEGPGLQPRSSPGNLRTSSMMYLTFGRVLGMASDESVEGTGDMSIP